MLWKWPTGRDLEGRHNAAQTGIPPLATMLALAVAQAVALIYVYYERAAEAASLIAYGIVALIVLGAVVGIMRATKEYPDKSIQPAFDSASVRWGSWVLLWILLGLGGAVTAVAYGWLPQKPMLQMAHLIKASDYEWNFDHSQGKKLVYRLSTPLGTPFPQTLRMTVQLGNSLASNWSINRIIGFEDADLTQELTRNGPTKDHDTTTSSKWVGEWFDLANRDYYFEVALHSKNQASRTELDEQLNANRQSITVTLTNEYRQ